MISKKMAHIWIGPLAPPAVWMESWEHFHPDWSYSVIDNAYLLSRKWRCHKQILHYIKKGRLEGVADLVRYEYLYDFGGLVLAADSICLRPVDPVFVENKVYAVFQDDKTHIGHCSPYIAAPAGHHVLDHILTEISGFDIHKMDAPWKSVGNRYLRDVHERKKFIEDGYIKALPSRSFNSGRRRDPDFAIRNLPNYGEDVYAIQMWGTTSGGYAQFNPDMTRADIKRGTAKLAEDFEIAMIRLGLEFD